MMKDITIQALVGSLCGDGCIRDQYKYPHYKEGHSIKQCDYLLWKMDLLGELNPKFITGVSRVKYNWNIKEHKTCEIYTRTNEDLVRFREMFYLGESRRKVICEEALGILDPLGLAIWYMDDGSYDCAGSTVHLTSSMMDIDQQKLFKKFFNNRYGLDSNVVKRGIRANGQRYSLCFTVDSSDEFLRIIKDNIHETMRYKLGRLDCINNDKIFEKKSKRRTYARNWYRKNKSRKFSAGLPSDNEVKVHG